MRSQEMTWDENYREVLTGLSTAFGMTDAAYGQAKRRRAI